jgi:hypothetical protein
VAIEQLRDIHFDFDRYDIRGQEDRVLDEDAAWLKSHGAALILIEGHCDERGTNEYNLALGQRRAMRGVGWVILCQDPATKRLTNHWVTLHQVGVPAGFKPLLVMDVWEHAYMRDYKATERGLYIDAFFRNVDWAVVDHRLREPAVLSADGGGLDGRAAGR